VDNESNNRASGFSEIPIGTENVVVGNLEGIKKLVADGEEVQWLRLQLRLDIYDRLSKQLETGTALYEKLILLDGAIIALSITFLTSLSTRLAVIHPPVNRPHLWMVAVSWALLIASVFCSYRTIIERHGACIRHITSISSEYHKYFYGRLGAVLTRLGALMKGQINHEGETLEISQVFERLNAALKTEGEATVKKMDDFIEEGKKSYHERQFAKFALRFAILGVLMLCIFTVMSLRMLF
jgi:hypothetical protein